MSSSWAATVDASIVPSCTVEKFPYGVVKDKIVSWNDLVQIITEAIGNIGVNHLQSLRNIGIVRELATTSGCCVDGKYHRK